MARTECQTLNSCEDRKCILTSQLRETILTCGLIGFSRNLTRKYLFAKIWGSLLILYTAYLKANSVGESWRMTRWKMISHNNWSITFWSSVKMAPILITRVGRLRLGSKLKRPMASGDQTIFVRSLSSTCPSSFLILCLPIKPVETKPSLFLLVLTLFERSHYFLQTKASSDRNHTCFVSSPCPTFVWLSFNFPVVFVSWLLSQFKEPHHDW